MGFGTAALLIGLKHLQAIAALMWTGSLTHMGNRSFMTS